ncbi:FAD/NAD(P)-binding protein [Nonomuraea endophytica]|uniref:Putative NAD(P)/FAD-binding protein YdhS n=1 Tax=Nonomuraea endophytica TaxID=714136 RepID=A0A7W8AGG5_9ACTN|nr:FAD/NAD(P)-binding protein [Nonomuraea endophytica]MBB5084681.1 putative NAD(P)/FAD-binding protein YdhS [Nonomuraea endophytica]
MRIAIVGGGAAAVALLDSLALLDARPSSVTVFEPSARLWSGRAYGPDLDAVRVNAPPVIMSIRHGDQEHYARWLGERAAAHLDERLGAPLVPRALYGEYLREVATAAMARLPVDVRRDRVTRVARHGAELVVRTSGGDEQAVDRVVLCVGGGTPHDLFGLAGTPGYVADPYPLARTLPDVPSDSAVAVIGSGLTAVDVVVALASAGHAGPITLMSRSGVLPHVWQRPVRYEPRHLTAARLRDVRTTGDVARLLRAELDELGKDFDAFAADLLATPFEDPVVRLRRQLAAIDAPELGRRIVQQAAHTLGPLTWGVLEDRDRLTGEHRRTAVSVSSPMVPVNAVQLDRLLARGQLTLVRGLRAVVPGFHITTTDNDPRAESGLRADGGLRADVVVNAVNPAPHSVPEAAASLVASLLADGLATTGPEGGLEVPAGAPLHVVGDLAAGGTFVTSSIPAVAAQAAATAQALADQ